MIKFLFTSDWHLLSKRPSNRIDENFFNNQLLKVDEIINYAVKERVNSIIHGGDFFDSPLPNMELLNIMVEKFRLLKERSIDIYITPGSHDLFGYNLLSIKETAIGNLISSGFLKLLIGLYNINGVKFYGIPCIVKHSLQDYSNVPDNCFCVTHNALVPEPVKFDHILFSEINFVQKVIFLCGHYHSVFKAIVNNNLFMNTGPLVRTGINEAEHSPNILHIETNSHNTIKKLMIPHLNNVFSTPKLLKEVSDFGDKLQTLNFSFLDLFDLTEQIAAHLKVSDKIKYATLERLKLAQESLRG